MKEPEVVEKEFKVQFTGTLESGVRWQPMGHKGIRRNTDVSEEARPLSEAVEVVLARGVLWGNRRKMTGGRQMVVRMRGEILRWSSFQRQWRQSGWWPQTRMI
jgi:hypothetical protein